MAGLRCICLVHASKSWKCKLLHDFVPYPRLAANPTSLPTRTTPVSSDAHPLAPTAGRRPHRMPRDRHRRRCPRGCVEERLTRRPSPTQLQWSEQPAHLHHDAAPPAALKAPSKSRAHSRLDDRSSASSTPIRAPASPRAATPRDPVAEEARNVIVYLDRGFDATHWIRSASKAVGTVRLASTTSASSRTSSP